MRSCDGLAQQQKKGIRREKKRRTRRQTPIIKPRLRLKNQPKTAWLAGWFGTPSEMTFRHFCLCRDTYFHLSAISTPILFVSLSLWFSFIHWLATPTTVVVRFLPFSYSAAAARSFVVVVDDVDVWRTNDWTENAQKKPNRQTMLCVSLDTHKYQQTNSAQDTTSQRKRKKKTEQSGRHKFASFQVD